jgi:hypothetical protein
VSITKQDRPGWFARHFPVPEPGWVAPAIAGALVIGSAGRAQDYLTRTQDGGSALTRGVEVAGYHVWGWLFAACAITVLLGLVIEQTRRNRWTVLLAHCYGAGLHVSYVSVLAQEIAGSGRGIGVVLPPAAAALTHLVCIGLFAGPRVRVPGAGR